MKWCETNYKSTFFSVCWNGWGLVHHFNTTPTHPIRPCTASLNTDSVIITHLSWNWSFRFSFILWFELLHKETALINYFQGYISIKQYNRIALMSSLAWNCHLTDLLLLGSVTGTWRRSFTSHMPQSKANTKSKSVYSSVCIDVREIWNKNK